MVKRQKRCCTEQDKNYPPLLAAPFGLTTITQPLCLTVKGIGVLLATLSMGNFINQTSKFSYYQLRPISSTRKYLSTEATVKLTTSLILSRLDYCNSLLSGLPAPSVHSLRPVRSMLLASFWKTNKNKQEQKQKQKPDQITPLFWFLHWLTVPQRIQYSINNLCYNWIMRTGLS